ncbi:MAG: glycerophosphodiester phosphodiesterase [Firmicutes bacterium]|nr:glycerophosphodiester phosphodiesterase [Bacillota bacterium]
MDIKKTWLFTKPIAHRGLHTADLPENSIAAFSNAAKCGFPVELDVRLLADGTIVVFHDDKLSRMTGRDGYISGIAADDLKNTNLWNIAGEPTEWMIPTFEKVLETINGQTPILIETKNQTACGPMESKVIEMLHSYKGEVAVQSFSPYSLEYFKKNAFEIPRGQLSTLFTKEDLPSALKRSILRRLKMNHVSRPDFVSYRFDLLPNKWVTRTKLPTLAWTVRSNADLERVITYCDNIIFENFIPQIEKGEAGE